MEDVAYEQSIFDEEQRTVLYAGFWERFAALFLDGLVLSPLSFINSYSSGAWYSIGVVVMTGLVALTYKPIMEYLYGATLGKKAMSIVVTNKAYEKPNLQEAVLRNIIGIMSKIISISFSIYALAGGQFQQIVPVAGSSLFQGLLGYSFVVGSIWALIYIADIIVFFADKQNRALHDFIGRTYVIKK
jgi:uncharacterized RDD family membrane protein YckC